jgi:4-hydroxybenzoate polyprenyltransferase
MPPARKPQATRRARPAPRSATAAASPPQPWWKQRAPLYWKLIRADRPIGWLLLLWPTWWGLWLAAEGFPPVGLLLIFTAGVWLTRSAGCIVNDYADRWLDGQVERTRERPLATGAVSTREALGLFTALMGIAFVLVLFTNRLTIGLAVVALLLACTYPFLKRHTYLPQVYLGISFGWSIPMAFAAVTGTVPALAWLAFLANVLWSTAYDTWYAMVDREDDLRAGAKSTAILFGDADLLALGVLQGGFLLSMFLVGQRAGLGGIYLAALGLAALLVAWQFWHARSRARERCFEAFRQNNWVGLVLWLGLSMDAVMR